MGTETPLKAAAVGGSKYAGSSKSQLQEVLKKKLREGISSAEYTELMQLLQTAQPSGGVPVPANPMFMAPGTPNGGGFAPVMLYPSHFPSPFQKQTKRRKSSSRRSVSRV